jgi:hypothetical protein
VKYCRIFIFFLIVNPAIIITQYNVVLEKPINYNYISWIKGSKPELLCPTNGYVDQLSLQPVFQLKLSQGKYKTIDFEFEERELTKNEMLTYKNLIFDSTYSKTFRKQEQNNKTVNQILLLNCIRKVGDELFLITNFKLSLQKRSNKSSLKKSSSFITQSVLNDGSNWYKLSNKQPGIYKIDYNFLITNSIIDGNIPSNNIHLFSNNTGLLSVINNNTRPDDLKQQSIFIYDGGDGVFSTGDYVLFQLNGPDKINWNGQNFYHTKHTYSDSAYCFLNISPNRNPALLDTVNENNENFDQTITKFRDFKYLNQDKINLLKSGSQWFGDVFDLTNVFNYPFSFNNCVDSSHIKLRLMSKSNYSSAYFYPSIFNETRSVTISSSGSSYYADVGKIAIDEFDVENIPNLPYELRLEYSNNGAPSSKGYLDYLEINCTRQLIIDNTQFNFRLNNPGNPNSYSEIVLNNANSVDMIWDISNLFDVKNIAFQKTGSTLSFKNKIDSLKHFIAVSGSNFPYPQFEKQILNQNLHANNLVDMIIVSPTEFLSAAQDLKSVHELEGLTVMVVTDEEIYNEFSGGIPDASAIKQFLRMFYVRENGNQNTIPKYCLLFGDGSYDNRNILGHNKNTLPIYESSESLSVVNTYATDDYFAILADGASMQNTDFLNIGVGRLVVSNLVEANEMVQKIRNYIFNEDNSTNNLNCNNNLSNSIYGDWRNKVVMVSDDEDNNAYFTDIEIMSSKVKTNKPSANILKIHSDAYSQKSTTVGERIPDAEAAINQKVQDGALIVNYIGHGGETGWAHEQILTVPTIQNWDNSKSMPVFMTATCEFGRFDDHDRVSAGEYVLLNKNGGGIALFTTTRLVYALPNEYLNRFFYDTVFDFVNQKPQRLGDIYVGTKNKFAQYSADRNYRKFALLGDPAIKLAIPEFKVQIDSFNKDTVNALSEVVVFGHLEDEFGVDLSNFNGKVYLTFYDKESSLTTLGTNPSSDTLPFKMWKNIIYRGKSSVSNGLFSFTFKVPKDIAYSYGFSRMSFYAENGNLDASGYNDSLIIGGIDTNATKDENGPDLELYLNDENFVSGGISNNEPLLIVSVFDENGINTVGNGIGHDIELVIDNDYSNSIILNDYYEADLDTYKSGEINFELSELSTGEHTIKIKVWDNYNNSSTRELNFIVVEENEIQLKHVLNYPNPFTTQTAFFFEHNQNCNFLDLSIIIYTVSGKIVKRINQRINNEGFRSEGINWDGKDDFDEQLAKGVYIYNLSITNEQGRTADKTQTMFLLK